MYILVIVFKNSGESKTIFCDTKKEIKENIIANIQDIQMDCISIYELSDFNIDISVDLEFNN